MGNVLSAVDPSLDLDVDRIGRCQTGFNCHQRADWTAEYDIGFRVLDFFAEYYRL
jgi:hypothetical protein